MTACGNRHLPNQRSRKRPPQSRTSRRSLGSRIASRAQPRTAPIEPKSDAPRLTVEFDGGSYRLDEPRARSISTFVDQNSAADKARPIVVNAYAYTGEGAISEARRLAYYRAMMARKQLIDAKVRAGEYQDQRQ